MDFVRAVLERRRAASGGRLASLALGATLLKQVLYKNSRRCATALRVNTGVLGLVALHPSSLSSPFDYGPTAETNLSNNLALLYKFVR